MKLENIIHDKISEYTRELRFGQALFGHLAERVYERNLEVTIFGFHQYGFQIAKALEHDRIKVSEFIDNDLNKLDKQHDGIICKTPQLIQTRSQRKIVVITVRSNPEAIIKQLLNLGFSEEHLFLNCYHRSRLGDSLGYYLSNCIVGQMAWEDPKSSTDKVSNSMHLIEQLYNLLADELSREILISRIALTCAGETYGALQKFLLDYSSSVKEKVRCKRDNWETGSVIAEPEFKFYFEQEFLNFLANEVYIDVGAEDGNTIIPLLQRLKSLNFDISKLTVHAFEPDEECFQKLVLSTQNFPNVHLYKTPIAEFDSEVRFLSSTNKLGSRTCGVIGRSSHTIPAENAMQAFSIDTLFGTRQYSLMKLDPGGNIIAGLLRGSTETIRRYKPKIIAGAYHSIESLWEVPITVQRIQPDYKLYIRHLAYHGNETHLFAIP